MTLPTLSGTLGVFQPVYIRKVDALADWGTSEDDLATRLIIALEKVFLRRHKSPFSFYLAENDEDLRRVMVALNENRRPQIQKLSLLFFLPAEVEQAAIAVSATEGRTRCGYASSLHRDLAATEEQLRTLCRVAMEAGRQVTPCPSATLVAAVFHASRDELCLASVPDSAGCTVSACPSHATT